MGLGPVEASRRALRLAGMSINDVDLVEINEAFAAQVIPSYRELGIDIDRLNVHGGAIALGHPYGMTGARITTTLLNGLVATGQDHRAGNHVRRRRPRHGDGPRTTQLSAYSTPQKG
jgi:acetyl-CoA C-acetyltransferase